MEKKIPLVLGLAALLISGTVLAFNFQNQGGKGFFGRPKCGNLKELDLPEDATPEEIRAALWTGELADLALTEDSTLAEFRAAQEAKREEMWQEKLPELKEKLGLPEDATEEEVKAALQEKRGECPGFCPQGGFRGRKMKGLF